MIRKEKAKKLKPVDAAYIAGIIDGEGSVMLTRVNKNEYRRICVVVSNCDENLLDWIYKKVGVGKVHPKKIYHKEHSPTFFYKVVGREALSLLEQIYPYLLTYKKERTKLILENFIRLTPRNGKYSKKILAEKKKFTKKFMKLNTTKRNQVQDYI